MAKRLSGSSARGALRKMKPEVSEQQWSEAEVEAVRKASDAQSAGRDLPKAEYEDIPRLTEEQLARMVRLRDVRRKVPVSVRLDPQVLDWLRAKGEGHLTRINDILTNLMEPNGARARGGSTFPCLRNETWGAQTYGLVRPGPPRQAIISLRWFLAALPFPPACHCSS